MFLTDLQKLKVTVNIMLLFKTQGKITENDDKTNITHRFNVPENIKSLKIKYSYSPKTVENKEVALKLVRECLEKYDERIDGKIEDNLPVKNLITLSLDDSTSYRGAAHRQSNEQEHIISEDYASPGFIKGKIIDGEWKIVLNVHYVGCDVDYNISIDGEVE